MSSQVNKSNVKFKPKVKQRVRRTSTARRSSVTINTTFSTPGDREALKARSMESAIEEDEFMPAREESLMPPPKVEAVREKIPEVPVDPVAPADPPPVGPESVEPPVPEPKPPAPEPPTPVPAPVQPETQPETQMSAPPSPKTVPQIIKGVPQPVQPIPRAVEPQAVSAPEVPEVPEAEKQLLPQQQQQQQQQQQAVVQSMQPVDLTLADDDMDDLEELDEDREPVYNKEGREIIEPRDLRRMGKYNAKIHYHNKVINADTFTMATLCGDVPIGEVNEDYYKYEEVRSSRKRNRALLLQAKRMVRGLYNPTTEHKRMQLLRVYKDWQDEREAKFGSKRPGVDLDSLEGPANGTASIQGPQLVKDSEGRIVVDTQSLVYDRHANNRADDENDQQTRVEANKFGDHINSYSFSNKERPERWTSFETETFYNAISAWGTDFNLIAQFFPQRTRGQIKTKFKYEERRNPDKLQLYMIHRKKVKLEDVARISGTKIVPAADIEADLEQVRREHEEQMRKEVEAREAAAKEDAQRKSMDHMRRRQAKGISGSSEVVGELPVKEEE